MSTAQTSDTKNKPKPDKDLEVKVNNKKVQLSHSPITGREIKEEAIAQGVEIQLDFLLTLNAHAGNPARSIADAESVEIDKHSSFSANDSDDDS